MLIVTPPLAPRPPRHLLVTKCIASNTRSQYKAVHVLPLAKNCIYNTFKIISYSPTTTPHPLVPPIYTPRTKIVALLNNTNVSIALSVFSHAFPEFFITFQCQVQNSCAKSKKKSVLISRIP